jgi:GNAT superfamily N-acetyltransferase
VTRESAEVGMKKNQSSLTSSSEQAIGEVTTSFDSKQDAPVKRLAATFRRLPEIVRFRSKWRVLLLVIRELFRPLLYWNLFEIVENDLRLPARLPYGNRRFTVRFHAGRYDFDRTLSILLPMGDVLADEIHARLRRGDVVAVAYADNEPVGYSWMTFSDGFELVWGTKWRVHSDEAVFYGSYVVPRWRGNGVHSWLDLEMNSYARQRGIIRTMGSISLLNSGSLNLARRQAKRSIMRVLLLRARGFGWTYRRAFGAPLSARFE